MLLFTRMVNGWPRHMKEELIAPCGMNCNVCNCIIQPDKYKIKCPGCLPRGRGCVHKKGLCEALRKGQVRFCYECDTFPCDNLITVDNRYKKSYNYSFIKNQKYIKEKGLDAFLEHEKKKFKCGNCGVTMSVQSKKCFSCGEGSPT